MPSIRQRTLPAVARGSATVLLTGETGTGKELVELTSRRSRSTLYCFSPAAVIGVAVSPYGAIIFRSLGHSSSRVSPE